MRLHLLLGLCALAQSYTVFVKPGADNCFMEEAHRGDRILLSFGVQSGGQMDIDVKIYGPDMKFVYKSERENENDIQFIATVSGIYRVCFENTMSTVTGKIVSFNLYVGDDLSEHDAAGVHHLDPLQKSINSLVDGVNGLNDHQSYMTGRLTRHEETILSTANRVFYYSLLETVVLLSVGLFQVWWIRRGFERKR